MKNLLLFWTLALCLTSYGQSKKQQIVALNYSIDSLNVVLSITKNKAAKDIGRLNKTIGDLSKEIAQLTIEVESLESSVSALEKDKSNLARENEKFKTHLEEISKTNVELEAKVKILNNEIASKERDRAELKNSTFMDNAEIAIPENPNEIYFEGTIELESMYDGVFFVSVRIDKGELAGKTERLYFRTGMEDSNSIDYTSNINFDGSGEAEGKKVTGLIIRSIGNFENYETGIDDSKEIYRVKEVNY
ncbi:MAG: hypothetical protein P8O87_07650 [Crocinitomicaceae bacterium]|nr:hypothetical protein [Crocinitomicaceae bacterium]